MASTVVESSNKFGLCFFQKLADKKLESADPLSNLVAPFGLTTLLTLAASGAAGTTQKEILSSLHKNGVDLESYQSLIRSLKNSATKMGTSIWVQEDNFTVPTNGFQKVLHSFDATLEEYPSSDGTPSE